jgi:hypothetical protein
VLACFVDQGGELAHRRQPPAAREAAEREARAGRGRVCEVLRRRDGNELPGDLREDVTRGAVAEHVPVHRRGRGPTAHAPNDERALADVIDLDVADVGIDHHVIDELRAEEAQRGRPHGGERGRRGGVLEHRLVEETAGRPAVVEDGEKFDARGKAPVALTADREVFAVGDARRKAHGGLRGLEPLPLEARDLVGDGLGLDVVLREHRRDGR